MAQSFWLNQAAEIAPEQAQINAMNAAGIPALLQAPNAQAAVEPSPLQAMIQQAMPGMVPKKIKITEKHMDALKNYLPKAGDSGSPVTDAYADQAKRALDDQKATLAGLNDYINQIAAKPQGINYTPLAAYVDSITGSKLMPAAQSMAPMSPEEKDKMLFGLRNQLAQGQAKLSGDQLKALQEQRQMQQFTERQMELERSHRANEAGLSQRGLGMLMRGQTAKDNQTAAAVDKVTNDAQLKAYVPRIQGADRILGQLGEVRSGKIVDTRQFLNDLNTEYVNLLTGANNSALGKQERTEYTTLAGDLSALAQKVSARPESINSPEILSQLEKSVDSLQRTYHKNYDQRASVLQRTYRFNPDATEQQAGKIKEMRGQFGEAAARPEGGEASGMVKVQKGSEVLMIPSSDVSAAEADGYKRVK